MNISKLLSVAALTLTFSSIGNAQTIKEGGGFGPARDRFTCEETNPVDPSNPILVYLTEGFDKPILRVFQGKQKLYVGNVVLDETINCIVPCEFYNNDKDQVGFNVTILPNLIIGSFDTPQGTVNLTCTKPQD